MLSRALLYSLALAGVLVSVGFVLIGLPEATPVQSVLLELSSLPLSVSTAAGIVILNQRATRPAGPRSRVVLWVSSALVVLGGALMASAYLFIPRGVVHFGQLLLWIGLLGMLLVMIKRQPRRRLTRFSLPDEEAEVPVEEGPERLAGPRM